MTRRVYVACWVAVLVFDVLAYVALLLIGTYGTLHHETGFYDEGGSPERTLMDLWMLWGLAPGLLCTSAMAGLSTVPRRQRQEEP